VQVVLRTLLEEYYTQHADDEHDAGGNSVDAIGIEEPPRVTQRKVLPYENSFTYECGHERKRRTVMQEGEEG
jgi:hypothetical protein